MDRLQADGKISSWQLLAVCLSLFTVVVVAFLPAIQNGFTNYDDDVYVTSNVQVQKGLTLENLGWAFRSTEGGNYLHPLTWLSHMLDCQIFGLRPQGHHLTSVLLHALNSVLLFLALRRLTGATGRSFLVAALFGLHPLRVESVAWVAERKDVLSGLFWMLTLWAYAGYVEQTGVNSPKAWRFYGVSLGFFALGLLSKPMVVTLPCVLLLLDFWPLRRLELSSFTHLRASLWPLLREKVPFFALTALASVAAFLVQNQAGVTSMMETVSLADRVGNALIAYCRYLGKLFCTANLAVFYPHPGHWPATPVALAALLLLGVTTLALALWRRGPYVAVGWFWFVGTLVPVIGLVQVGGQSMADRYTYVPMVGVCLSLVWGVHALTRRWRYSAIILSVAGTLLLALCIPATRRQIGYWKDNETLFRHAVTCTKDNSLANMNLGNALSMQGKLDEAIRHFREAIRVNPDYADAHFNLAGTLSEEGQLDEAVTEYYEAARLNPHDAASRNNLGMALFKNGRLDEAVGQLQEGLKLNPDDAAARYVLGVALFQKGQWEEALGQFHECLRLDPSHGEARYTLASAMVQMGRNNEAISHLRLFLKSKPEHVEARSSLGIALAGTGQFSEAVIEFREAVRIAPNDADTHFNLANVLSELGQWQEALAELRETLRLRPDNAEARKQVETLNALPSK